MRNLSSSRPEKFGGPTARVGVTQTVKPVAAYSEPLFPVPWNRICGRDLRHRRVEGGVEAGDRGDPGENGT